MKYIIGLLLILIIGKLFATNLKEKVTNELKLGEAVQKSESYFYNNEKTKVIYSYMGKSFLMGKNELPNVDIDSFLPISNEYAYDKNNFYWKNKIIENIDKVSFVILGKDYSKDNYNVFFENKIIKEADSETFKLGGRFEAEDKKYCYTHGVIEYTKVNRDWSYQYLESINTKIELLTKIVTTSDNEIKVLQSRKHFQELLDKKDSLVKLIKIFKSKKELSNLFELYDLKKIINFYKNLKIEKSEKYSVLSYLYEFDLIVNRTTNNNHFIGEFLKESIDIKSDDRTIYRYAQWLFNKGSISEAKVYFKKLLVSKYRENILIRLSTITFLEEKNNEALEYYSKINVSNITKINTKEAYIKLLEKLVELNIKQQEFNKAQSSLTNVLAFYQNVAESNPYVYEELAYIYRQFFIVYDGLKDIKRKKDSFEKSIMIYTSLNKAFPSKFEAQLEELKSLEQKLGD